MRIVALPVSRADDLLGTCDARAAVSLGAWPDSVPMHHSAWQWTSREKRRRAVADRRDKHQRQAHAYDAWGVPRCCVATRGPWMKIRPCGTPPVRFCHRAPVRHTRGGAQCVLTPRLERGRSHGRTACVSLRPCVSARYSINTRDYTPQDGEQLCIHRSAMHMHMYMCGIPTAAHVPRRKTGATHTHKQVDSSLRPATRFLRTAAPD